MEDEESLGVLEEGDDVLAPLLEVGLVEGQLEPVGGHQRLELVGHLLPRLRRALVQHLPDQLLEQLLQCARVMR